MVLGEGRCVVHYRCWAAASNVCVWCVWLQQYVVHAVRDVCKQCVCVCVCAQSVRVRKYVVHAVRGSAIREDA